MTGRQALSRTRIVGAALILFAAGCSGEKQMSAPSTQPVTGTLKYKDAPVADATVTFHPDGEQRSAFARTDAAGNFKLTTVQENDGAMVGSYRVTVTKMIDENAEAPSTDIAAPRKAPKFKNELPAKYEKPETSGLTAKVGAGGPNTVSLQLAD